MSNEDVLWWSLGLLIIVAVALIARQHFKFDRLKKRFETLLYVLNRSLRNRHALYSELLNDSSGLNNDRCKFENHSLAQHQVARGHWARFTATFASAQSKEEKALEFQRQFSAKCWWQLPPLLERALKELGEDECKELSEKLNAEAVTAASELKFFDAAFKSNDRLLKTLTTQVNGAAIPSLFEELKPIGLFHPRYQEAFTKAQSQLEELRLSVQRDPIESKSEAAERLQKRTAKLMSMLRRALTMHKSLEAARSQFDQLCLRVELLRRERLSSTLTRERYFKTGYTLDEPGFEAQNPLDQSGILLELMHKALVSRRLYSFTRDYQAWSTLTARVNLLLQEIQDDKSFVDAQMKTIDKQSSAEDRKADKAQRSKIRRLYKAQHWHAAMLEVKQLLLEHGPRVQAREQIGRLAKPLSTVHALLQAHPNVVSYELDDAFQFMTVEIAELHEQAAASKANWSALTQKAEEITLGLVGPETESLYCRANREVEAFREAGEELTKLKGRVRSLNENLGSWCGTEALSRFQELQAQISEVIAGAAIVKQDWRQLFDRVVEANALLDELNALLETALETHKSHESQIGEFEKLLSKCLEEGAYSRVVCGTRFGAGIFIQDDELQQLLAQAKADLGLRAYESIDREIHQAQTILFRENLEAWWLSLQLMANSDVPCARSFALKEGYKAGGFDSWIQEQMQIDEKRLYVPSSSACAHKGRIIYAQVIRTDDFPVLSDYDGGLVAAG